MIIMRGKRVAVERLVKATAGNSMFAMPEDASAVGLIKYVGNEVSGLSIGQKVYYGKNRHELKMEGKDILIMDEDNIYAIVTDDTL